MLLLQSYNKDLYSSILAVIACICWASTLDSYIVDARICNNVNLASIVCCITRAEGSALQCFLSVGSHSKYICMFCKDGRPLSWLQCKILMVVGPFYLDKFFWCRSGPATVIHCHYWWSPYCPALLSLAVLKYVHLHFHIRSALSRQICTFTSDLHFHIRSVLSYYCRSWSILNFYIFFSL